VQSPITNMKSHPFISRVLTALLCGAALVSAHATAINVTVDPTGNLYNGIGVATKAEYGYSNNNPDSNLGFLTTVVGNYNSFNNPDLPTPYGPVAASFDLSGDSYASIGGYDYVVFHFGAGQAAFSEAPVWIPDVVVPATYHTSGKKAGQVKTPSYVIPGYWTNPKWEKSQGGWWAAFYIGGMAGINFTIPTPGPTYNDLVYNGKPVGGFSSARYFNPTQVPDGGATAMLLGLGLLAVGLWRRRHG
jgi:hypothetical protein